jgi:hypothetical protein
VICDDSPGVLAGELVDQEIGGWDREMVMKQILIIIGALFMISGSDLRSLAWIYVPDQGDTGWQTFTYTAGSVGFSGTAGFMVSNVMDNSAYSELLLDNLRQADNGADLGFERGNVSGLVLLGGSFATVSQSALAISGNRYTPTQGEFLADLQAVYTGVDTSGFRNARGQAGTVGSILEVPITLEPGAKFSFDWAFLGSDYSPHNDFALFYVKNQSGVVVFSKGLAQIDPGPARTPIAAIILLLDPE